MRQQFDAALAVLAAWFGAFTDALGRRARMFRTLIDIQSDKLAADSKAQSGTVTTVVTVGATLLIGIIVMAQIVESMPALDNNTFSGAMDQVTSILNSSFLLAAILPLVIVAGAVLFFVGNFGNGGNGR
jgi:nitrogen fixation/metabolism regulation signal transduction histidine kinase